MTRLIARVLDLFGEAIVWAYITVGEPIARATDRIDTFLADSLNTENDET